MLLNSKNSVSKVNSNGFALFVIGLTLAGFFGGALRLLLNSEKVQHQILSEVQKRFPEWEVKAATAELHLSSGVWPGVTVELPHAKAVREGNCHQPSLDVELFSLKIPVGLWSILTKQNRLGLMSVERLEVELNTPPPCEEPSSQGDMIVKETPPSANQTRDRLGLRTVYEEISDHSRGLFLGEAVIRGPANADWSYKVKDLRLKAGARVTLTTGISVWKNFPAGELRQDFKISGSLHGSLLEWDIRSSIKEGELRWSGQLDEDGRTFLHKLALRQGPINDILEMLHKVGLAEKSSKAKRVWVNCEIVQSGGFQNLNSLHEVPVKIESCGMDGELGRVTVSPQIFYLKEPFFRNGVLPVQLNQFSLEALSDILNLPKMSLVFSNLGFWSGRVELSSLEKFKMEGEIEGLKLSLSNKSLRGVETLTSVQTQISFDQKKLNVTLSDFQIFGGSRGGLSHLEYDMKTREGLFDLEFDSLSPSSSVQGLLFQGKVEPLHIKFKGKIQQDQLKSLSGEFFSNKAEGRGWVMEKVKGRLVQIQKEHFKMDLEADKFLWMSAFRYNDLSDRIVSSFQLSTDKKELTDVEIEMDIFAQEGKISKATAQLDSKKVEFIGSWQRGEALMGKVRVGRTSLWREVRVDHSKGELVSTK